MDNYSLSDVAAVTRNNGYGDGCGYGMGGWWMIILFALIFNGNGFWGNRGWFWRTRDRSRFVQQHEL